MDLKSLSASMDWNYLYTSMDGRIRRKHFWIGILLLLVAVFAANFLVGFLFGLIFGEGGFVVRLVTFLFALAAAYPTYAVYGKRFQDRNKDPKFALIGIGLGLFSSLLALFGLLAPDGILVMVIGLAMIGVGIWYLVDLGILEGTPGPNAYGPDPKAAEHIPGTA